MALGALGRNDIFFRSREGPGLLQKKATGRLPDGLPH
jgi:hypothetical protein